jgi:hypothetical protein
MVQQPFGQVVKSLHQARVACKASICMPLLNCKPLDQRVANQVTPT